MIEIIMHNEAFLLGFYAGAISIGALGIAFGYALGRDLTLNQVRSCLNEMTPEPEIASDPIDPMAAIRRRMAEIERGTS